MQRSVRSSRISPYQIKLAVTSGNMRPTRHHILRHAIVPLGFPYRGKPALLLRNLPTETVTNSFYTQLLTRTSNPSAPQEGGTG